MESEKKPTVWEDDAKTFLLPPSGQAPASPAPAATPEPSPAAMAAMREAEPDEESVLDEGDGDPEPPLPVLDREPLRRSSLPAAVPDEEPFERPGTTRVGLLGGRGVGKSYLFHAMVYRTLDSRRAGALSYYIDRDTVRVYQTLDRGLTPRSVIPTEFIEDYSSWSRLHSTTILDQYWYRLRLQFRTGLLGTRRSFLDIDFLDGSGEGFETGFSKESEALWKAAFLDARVMVFCLPLWAAFPAAGGALSDDDWEHRQQIIRGFDSVVRHFKDLREKYKATHPVRSILALTMADDRRSALATLRDRWIHPFVTDPMLHLRAMRSASGVARYLANARQVSAALWQELDASAEPVISGIPLSLEFGAGRPWFIPVSAVDGAVLDARAQRQSARSRGLTAPVPVHVELPLLVALCESHNALM
jgi:hypothetical protein